MRIWKLKLFARFKKKKFYILFVYRMLCLSHWKKNQQMQSAMLRYLILLQLHEHFINSFNMYKNVVVTCNLGEAFYYIKLLCCSIPKNFCCLFLIGHLKFLWPLTWPYEAERTFLLNIQCLLCGFIFLPKYFYKNYAFLATTFVRVSSLGVKKNLEASLPFTKNNMDQFLVIYWKLMVILNIIGEL